MKAKTKIMKILFFLLSILLCSSEVNLGISVENSEDYLSELPAGTISRKLKDFSTLISENMSTKEVQLPSILNDMINVEGGTFSMGPSVSSASSYTVTLSSFSICKFEVSQDIYKRIMGKNPSYFSHFSDSQYCPAEGMSWYDAIVFCNILSSQMNLEKVYSISGKTVFADFNKNGFRLPTEAEWEFAARGGNLSKDFDFSGSDNAEEVAWYIANSEGRTYPVGLLKPNELGLYDMNGNVFEWCWDCFDDYPVGNYTNPHGPENGDNRVVRGGYFRSSIKALSMVFRLSVPAITEQMPLYGIRLARSL